MAINTQKFLSKTEAPTTKVISTKSFPVMLSKKSIKDIGVIKVKLIEIDSLLKGTLAIEKKKLDTQKRQESSKRREREEEKLETKPQAEKGVIKTPSLPRIGFLAWIKNFIGNVILGYFAVRLIDFLPLAVPIVKFIGRATDFVIDIGGKLLDGLATFIDWGYKAYDATRGFMKNMFGQNQAKEFDRLSGALNQFLNLALIVGMATAAGGGFSKPGKGPQGKPGKGPGGKPTVTQGRGGQAPTGRPKITGDTGPNWWTKITSKLKGGPFAKLSGPLSKFAGSAIPFAGSAIGALDAKARFSRGEQLGGWMASISSALDAFSGVAALTGIGLPVAAVSTAISIGIDAVLLVSDIVKAFGGPSVPGMAGGGRAPATRGGVARGGVKRQIQDPGRKGKYKRGVAPRKPGKVEINSPGADAGGQEKIFGIFPKPKLPDEMNPFNVIKKTGEELGKSDYFGPILAITSKITAGQLPTSKDYENVGLGLNLLISKGIREKQLKGGLVAAFAEGGLVDPDVLSAAETGGDISNWVAKTFQGEIESNAQKTLRMIRENAEKKKLKQREEKISPTGDMRDAVISESEMDLFQRLIVAESGGQGLIGQALVARSVLNRAGLIQSGKATKGTFNAKDSTVTGVITGRGQYQPYADGNPNGSINRPRTQTQMSSAKEAIKLAQNPDRLKSLLKSEGLDDGTINKLLAATGFRAGYAFDDPSQNVNVVKYKDHYFNTAGNTALIVASSQVSEKINPISLRGGDGRFIQGNSGRSDGTHFHIGTTKPGDGSGVAAAGFNVIKHFLGKKSIYVGRSGEFIPGNAKDDQIRGYIGRGQAAHRQTELDLQIGGLGADNKVAFPLALRNMKYSETDGYGVSADIVGVNAFVGHGRYKPDGTLALQQRRTLNLGAPDFYAFHGKSFGIVPKGGMRLTLHEGEVFKVVDKDSAKLLGYDLTKDIISIENNSDLIARAPSIIQKLKSISGYTDYEQPYEDPQVVTVYVPVPVNGNSGSSGGGDTVIVASGESNPFRSFYKGT